MKKKKKQPHAVKSETIKITQSKNLSEKMFAAMLELIKLYSFLGTNKIIGTALCVHKKNIYIKDLKR